MYLPNRNYMYLQTTKIKDMKNLENPSEKLGLTALFWVAKVSFVAKEKQKRLPDLSSHPSRECKLSLTAYHTFAVKRDAPIHFFFFLCKLKVLHLTVQYIKFIQK